MNDLHPRIVYTPGRILLASALGGLPAGLYLYRHNATLFGKAKEGTHVWVFGIIATALGIIFALFVNAAWAQPIIHAMGPASVIVPFVMSRRLQTDAIRLSLDQGAVPASYLKAGGIGLFSLVIIFGLSFALRYLTIKAG